MNGAEIINIIVEKTKYFTFIPANHNTEIPLMRLELMYLGQAEI